MPILGQRGKSLHFRLFQDQQHEDVIGHFPFAPDSVCAGGPEAKSGVNLPKSLDAPRPFGNRESLNFDLKLRASQCLDSNE